MASRLLSAALELAAVATVATSALVLAGCPHDWSTYASVPTEAPPNDSSPADPGAQPEAGAGVDAPDVSVYAALAEKPILIAADDEGIVFATREGSVLGCGHDSCTSMRTIASGQHDIRGVALGEGFVAWAARGDHVARRAPRSVPGPAEEVDENDGLVAVAVTATRLYFAVDAIGALIGGPDIRFCQPGIDCQNLALATFADGQVTEMVFDQAQAFWLADGTVNGCSIDACNGDSSKKMVLATEPVLPSAITVDPELAFYASPADGGSLHALSRAALVGAPAAPHLLAPNVGIVTRLAATRHSVWMTNAATGAVTRVPRLGGAPVTVATGLASPTGIASAGGYVYVTCSGDGRVLRWKQD